MAVIGSSAAEEAAERCEPSAGPGEAPPPAAADSSLVSENGKLCRQDRHASRPIAATTQALNLPPLDPPARRSSYPAPVQNDDQLWRAIDKNVEALVDDRSATGKPVN
jgi:hypothetical protein